MAEFSGLLNEKDKSCIYSELNLAVLDFAHLKYFLKKDIFYAITIA